MQLSLDHFRLLSIIYLLLYLSFLRFVITSLCFKLHLSGPSIRFNYEQWANPDCPYLPQPAHAAVT